MTTLSTPSLASAFAINRRVLYALLMREIITRFGRENIGVLWLVGEPMIFTLGIVTLWSMSGMNHGHAIPIVTFAITGYSSVLLWRNAASRAGGAVEQNKQLLYHRNVLVLDTLLTRILVELVGATGSFIVLISIFGFFGWMKPPENILMVIGGWLMLAWFGSALALMIGAGSAYSPIVERLWHPAAYLIFPLSGAAFMVEWLPVNLRSVVTYFPMVHGIELLRAGYFGNAVKAHYDIGYMAEVCLGMTLMGLYLVREASYRLEH